MEQKAPMSIELMSIEFRMRVTREVGEKREKNMIFPFKQFPVQTAHFNSMKCTTPQCVAAKLFS